MSDAVLPVVIALGVTACLLGIGAPMVSCACGGGIAICSLHRAATPSRARAAPWITRTTTLRVAAGLAAYAALAWLIEDGGRAGSPLDSGLRARFIALLMLATLTAIQPRGATLLASTFVLSLLLVSGQALRFEASSWGSGWARLAGEAGRFALGWAFAAALCAASGRKLPRVVWAPPALILIGPLGLDLLAASYGLTGQLLRSWQVSIPWGWSLSWRAHTLAIELTIRLLITIVTAAFVFAPPRVGLARAVQAMARAGSPWRGTRLAACSRHRRGSHGPIGRLAAAGQLGTLLRSQLRARVRGEDDALLGDLAGPGQERGHLDALELHLDRLSSRKTTDICQQQHDN